MTRDPAPRPALPAAPFDSLERVRELISGTSAAATRRAYRTGWAQWCDWCAAHGHDPLAGAPEPVAFFLAQLSLGRRLATLRCRLAAIAAAHRLAGVELDTGHRLIRAVLRGLEREQSGSQARQARPLLFELLAPLLVACDPTAAAGARDRVLLLIGFGAALRRSELVALDVADVEVVAQGVVVRVRRSKTDQAGRGALVAIHRSAQQDLCPAGALQAWLARRGEAPGPLFTRIRKGGRVTPARLSGQSVARIVRRAATTAGLAPEGLSGHSLRAGLATSAALAGADLAAVMAQTRHRSADVARRYIRNAEIWRNNVTELLFRAAG